MNRISSLLMAAAIGLVAVGTGVAIVQPGDMGDDDSAEVSSPDVTEAPDQDDIDDPVVGDPEEPDDSADPTVDTEPEPTTETTDTTESTEATSTTTAAAESTTTTSGSSGLDADGVAEPADTADGLASTGGESMIVAGAALAALALGLRRRSA